MKNNETEANNKSGEAITRNILDFIIDKFNLDADKAQNHEVIENIAKGVEFKGTNLWVLVFATFIASLGLNVNSAAVIIGAMLISPLMGPIMGIGLALGINDFDLMKRSIRNVGFMVLVGMLTSTLFFTISPLSSAQSELLARTTPTTYDVLIAFFGGLAGFVAQSRKERTPTVISGVAIATALMPPLCTAGYGLATGQIQYFIGAFYLFFINAVFIASATYVMVRFLKFDYKVFIDKQREKRVKIYMLVIAFFTIVPSVILGYRIVKTSIFEGNVDKYISRVLDLDNTQVIDYTTVFGFNKTPSTIEIILIGETLSKDVIQVIESQMPYFGLKNTKLIVKQSDGTGTAQIDFSDLQENYTDILLEKNAQIKEMEKQISTIKRDTIAYADISREAGAILNNINSIALSRNIYFSTNGKVQDTVLNCVIRPNKVEDINTEVLKRWLTVRTKFDKVHIHIDWDNINNQNQ